MNIIFFDPSFVTSETLIKISTICHINEVYNLMPSGNINYKIQRIFDSKIKIWRKQNESLDDVTKRAVYTLLDKVSSPIFIGDEYVGKEVHDVFTNSNSKTFLNNLNLDDPNILVLLPYFRLQTEINEVKFMSYFFNIIKKSDKSNRYDNRICRITLSPFISLKNTDITSLQQIERNDYKKAESELLTLILQSWDIKYTEELRKILISEEGIEKYHQVLKDIEREELEQQRAAYKHESPAERWDIASEMEYIRNNGGDWIDY